MRKLSHKIDEWNEIQQSRRSVEPKSRRKILVKFSKSTAQLSESKHANFPETKLIHISPKSLGILRQ